MEKYVKYKTKYLQMKGGSDSTCMLLNIRDICKQLPKTELFKYDGAKIGSIYYDGINWFLITDDDSFSVDIPEVFITENDMFEDVKKSSNFNLLVNEISEENDNNIYRNINGKKERITTETRFIYPEFKIYSKNILLGKISFTSSVSQWFYSPYTIPENKLHGKQISSFSSKTLNFLIITMGKIYNQLKKSLFFQVYTPTTPTTPDKSN